MHSRFYEVACDIEIQLTIFFVRTCNIYLQQNTGKVINVKVNLARKRIGENLHQRFGRKTLTNWEWNPSTHSRYLKLLRKISSKPRDLGWVAKMLAEFPLWIAMLIRSSRYDEDLGSPVAAISFLPNSLKNVEACIPKTP